MKTLQTHRRMIEIGVGAFLACISKTVGNVRELARGTIDPSGRGSMQRPGLGGTSEPAAATQNGQSATSPGQMVDR